MAVKFRFVKSAAEEYLALRGEARVDANDLLEWIREINSSGWYVHGEGLARLTFPHVEVSFQVENGAVVIAQIEAIEKGQV